MVDIEKNRRMSDADRDKLGRRLEKDYAKGASLAALAQQHGTSAGRVRLILLERGVTLRSRGGSYRKPDPARIKQAKVVAAGYRRGASLASLGRAHGVSATTTRKLVLAGGGDLRPRGNKHA